MRSRSFLIGRCNERTRDVELIENFADFLCFFLFIFSLVPYRVLRSRIIGRHGRAMTIVITVYVILQLNYVLLPFA